MTNRRDPPSRRAPLLCPGELRRSSGHPLDEVVKEGIRDADAALIHLGNSGVLLLSLRSASGKSQPPRLQVLRRYAELRRVLLSDGRELPATSLVAHGFTSAEIAHFDALIATGSF